MILSDLRSRTLEAVGEDPADPIFFTGPQAIAALNRAQRLFALLTLCLEQTGSLALTAGDVWYTPRSTFGDWIVPLRVELPSGSNPRVRAARLSELRALDATWEAQTGTVGRYASLGLNLLAIYPHSAAGGTTLDVTYAYEPARLAADADTPEIPEEHHPALIDFAVVWLRLVEGGQELEKEMPRFERFRSTATRFAAYVGSRSRDLRYDYQPLDLTLFDWSRLLTPTPRGTPWLTQQSEAAPRSAPSS